MSTRNSKVSSSGLLSPKPLFLWCLSNILLVAIIAGFNFPQWHDENALLENVQAAVLLGGCLLCLPQRAASRISNALRLVFSVLCLSFLLRELDVEKMPLPAVLQNLGSGEGRVITLALLWSFALYRLCSSGLVPRIALRTFVQSPQFKILLIVLVLLLVSFVFDKQFIAVAQHRLFEELAETNAYLLLVLFILPAHAVSTVVSPSSAG